MSLSHVFLPSWLYSDVNSFLIGWCQMSTTQACVTCHMWHVYKIGKRIPFSKQCTYVTNPLYLCVTNYYILVFTVILLLPMVCFNLANASISWNTTYSTIVIFGLISTGHMNLFDSFLYSRVGSPDRTDFQQYPICKGVVVFKKQNCL